MAEINLQRRIKKHVKGRKHSIAGICHPAVQDLLRRELRLLGIDSREEYPGVELFSAGIEDIYRVHLYCRIAASFRIRLDEFRCGSREDLFSRIRGFPWEYWIGETTPIRIKMSLQSARIQHEGRAQESASKAVQGRMDEIYPRRHSARNGEAESGSIAPDSTTLSSTAPHSKAPHPQVIHIRIEHSRASISLEASGNLLYRRGYAPAQGLAPLRENLAAAIVQAAPFPIPLRIVDAMAGSGTFLFEALLSALGLPPLPQREFSFHSWPVYRPEAENYLRKKALGEIASSPDLAPETRRGDFHGVEIAENVFNLLEKNVTGFRDQLSYLMGETDVTAPGITLSNEDFFVWIYDQLEPGGVQISGEPGLLICNPPYNWRVRSHTGLYRRIWNLFTEILPTWFGIVLIPLNSSGKPFLAPEDVPPHRILKRSSTRDFPHGGKRIRALYIHPAAGSTDGGSD